MGTDADHKYATAWPIDEDRFLDYLRDMGQEFCTDPSNADLRFTRNRLRNELLPLLERHYNVRIVESLLRLGHVTGEMYDELSKRRKLEDFMNTYIQLDMKRMADAQQLETQQALSAAATASDCIVSSGGVSVVG